MKLRVPFAILVSVALMVGLMGCENTDSDTRSSRQDEQAMLASQEGSIGCSASFCPKSANDCASSCPKVEAECAQNKCDKENKCCEEKCDKNASKKCCPKDCDDKACAKKKCAAACDQ